MGKSIAGFFVGVGLIVSIWLAVAISPGFFLLIVLFGLMTVGGIVVIASETWDK